MSKTVCTLCEGSGECVNCAGSGEIQGGVVKAPKPHQSDVDTGQEERKERTQRCPECNATGRCRKCRGTGKVEA